MVFYMSNTIKAKVEFDYKGVHWEPELLIDLNEVVNQKLEISNLYINIAKANNIGLYSYELEIMESYPIHFYDATGLAVPFCEAGSFDLDKFKACYLKNVLEHDFEEIVQRHMGTSLSEVSGLQEAMLEAYNLNN
jgi:hypothetical protein